jgi:hypothetical protein
MRRPLLSASADSTLAAPRPGEQPTAPIPVADDAAGHAEPEQNQSLPKPGPPSDDDPSGPYEFPALIDPTPRESAFAPSGVNDETLAMRLDLGSLDVDTATAPSWSMVGDDPLIVGDELQ